MYPHEQLKAWQLCHALTLAIYATTGRFPPDERFGLVSQARRAAFSAAANIVEGCARRGSAEFRRFLNISLGSLAELSYTLRLARDLGIMTQEEWRELEDTRNHAGVVTWKLYRSLQTK